MAFWRTYYHIIWTTKDREERITPDREKALLGFLLRKAHEIGVIVYAIAILPDHVHLIVAIPPRLSVAHAVKHLKGASSHAFGKGFAWERGYGVMSFGESQRARAMAYVQHQRELHAQGRTNNWLERVDEYNAPPPDLGVTSEEFPTTLREPGPRYHTSDSPTDDPIL